MSQSKTMVFLGFFLLELACALSFAQQAKPIPAANKPALAGAKPIMPVNVKADELEYEADQKLMTARGHVVVTRGKDILKADYITVRTDTQDAHAVGNVLFDREGSLWKGDEMTYNFRTRVGNFGQFNAVVAPFYVRAEDSKRASPDEFVLHNATITTCEGDRPDVYLKAREARVIKQNTIVARGVVFYVGAAPIFYVPKWTRNIKGDKTDIDVVPGYGSRVGAYLLTAYNYRMECGVTASTHLDYRTKRGVGAGQDFSWGDPLLDYRGELKTYYTRDKSPFEKRNEAELENLGNLVDNDRYRVRLSDVHSLSDRDYATTELNYLSDPAVLEDFFDDEYRHNVQPENRVSLVHRADKFTAGIEFNKRLNDFYGNVDRLPEATLDAPRMQLGESPFYYETHNAASSLERVFPENSDADNYDAFRLDSSHTVFYPTKNFGFLNVIPRAGYRGTYYSKTYEQNTQTNLVTVTDTNGLLRMTNEVTTTSNDTGSDLRNLYELGFESSLKSFGLIHNDWIGRDDQGLRHVVEPYMNYTYIPEPNLTPDQLPQFDGVDTLDKRNDVLLGVRNKLQTKRRGAVHDLVDVNIWSTYYVEKPEGTSNEFSDIFFKTELRPVDWLPVDFKGSYDQYEGKVDTFDTQVSVLWPDQTRLAIDYRYADNSYDQLASELTLFPSRRWSFNAYERYSFENSQIEEQSYFVDHKGRCVGWGVGYRKIDEDIQVWFRVWLMAFPKSPAFLLDVNPITTMNAKYLVTGGGGFIGSNIVSRLAARGEKVRVLDDFSTGRRQNLAGIERDIELIEGDIRDNAVLKKAMKGVRFVLHLAAIPSVVRSVEDPLTTNSVNVCGTLRVFLGARDAGVERVVFSSSSSVYGDTPTLPKREDMNLMPGSPYALSKLAGEYYGRMFHALYGLKVFSLRYFNVFGPRQNPKSQYAAVIPRFIDALKRGLSPVIHGDGNQTRDFTFVDNVIAANLACCIASAKSAGSVCNIGCGDRITINDLATKIAAILGKDIRAIHDAPQKGDVRDSQADISCARRLIRWTPRVNLKTGLRKTVEWFMANA